MFDLPLADVHLVHLDVLPLFLATVQDVLLLVSDVAGPGDIVVGVDALHSFVVYVQDKMSSIARNTGGRTEKDCSLRAE